MQVKKQQLEPDMEQWTRTKFGKEYFKAVYCHLAYLTYMQNTSCEMLGCMKRKLKSNFGSDINNDRYADDTTLMAESEEEPKSLLMTVKKESESWLKTQHSKNEDNGIWSHHLMANGWGNNGNSVRLLCIGAPKSLQMVIAAVKLKFMAPWKESYDQPS